MIPWFKVSVALCVFLMLGWFDFQRTLAEPHYLLRECTTNKTFPPESAYRSNRNILLSSLTDEAANDKDGFANYTMGQGPPNQVYGLYLCRGDLGTHDCYDCVANAAQAIRLSCKHQKAAIIWYEECLLRYSNEYIFSTMEVSPSIRGSRCITVQECRDYESIIGYLATKAANSKSNKKLAVTNSAGQNYPYALVQCTPDLTVEDCITCINSSFPMDATQIVTPSCTLRVDNFQFYNETAFMVDGQSFIQIPSTLHKGKHMISHGLVIALAAIAALSALILFAGWYVIRRRRRRRRQQKKHDTELDESVNGEITAHRDALKFDFGTIQSATNNFINKLGAGGFGEVYKGILHSGQEIAVKKLSVISEQDVEGFNNEAIMIAKLQHRNLVRLLGFCMTGKEKLLVYEFVPNKSLDFFLFDNEKCILLDWTRRYNIAVGIARGLLYLHQDSMLQIIHRDIKASNILLDDDFNPKISDFGMARILGVHGTLQNTNEVVGSYGYMAPEYAMHGHFSEKSDVYSFGILLLEILSGKKNLFFQSECTEDLPTYVWKHWKDRAPLRILDSSLRGSFSRSEAIRCIHISLLCVQEDPSDRPTMATIVHMLNDYTVALSMPRQPAFFFSSRVCGWVASSTTSSANDVSITTMYPR